MVPAFQEAETRATLEKEIQYAQRSDLEKAANLRRLLNTLKVYETKGVQNESDFFAYDFINDRSQAMDRDKAFHNAALRHECRLFTEYDGTSMQGIKQEHFKSLETAYYTLCIRNGCLESEIEQRMEEISAKKGKK